MTSTDSTGGEWVPTPIADVKDGARVRACGVEGVAEPGGFDVLRVLGTAAPVLRVMGTAAVIDVWVPALPHLPLPTTLLDAPFIWGRAGEGRDLYVGPMLTTYMDGIRGVQFLTAYGDHIDPADVTRLPIPADVLAALTADEAPQGGDDRG